MGLFFRLWTYLSSSLWLYFMVQTQGQSRFNPSIKILQLLMYK